MSVWGSPLHLSYGENQEVMYFTDPACSPKVLEDGYKHAINRVGYSNNKRRDFLIAVLEAILQNPNTPTHILKFACWGRGKMKVWLMDCVARNPVLPFLMLTDPQFHWLYDAVSDFDAARNRRANLAKRDQFMAAFTRYQMEEKARNEQEVGS